MQHRAALDGGGIAYTLLDAIERPVREGRLVALLQDWAPRPPGLYLYYSSRRRVPAPLQAFIELFGKERHVARSTRR